MNRSPLKRTPMLREGAAPRKQEDKIAPPAHAPRTTKVIPSKVCAWEKCGKEFTPAFSSTQICCSWRCAGAMVEAQGRERAKAERERLKEVRETIPKLIAAAQRDFNAYIRERDRDKGCFVCLRPFDQSKPGRALHAGHVRTRGAAGHLRFVEDNCMGECEGCNGPRGAKPHQIKAGAIQRIGSIRFAELENDNTPHKWTREELREIAATYRAKLKALKQKRSEEC